MTIKITACCDKCDASKSFTDSTLVNPWLNAHQCPTPPVELPTEATLGWMAVAEDGTGGPGNLLAVWRKRANGNFDGGHLGTWSPEYVTTFTPAVAAPKPALDELRAAFSNPRVSSNVNRFLAAVDEANEANR